jgi:hypothetical protein
MEQLLRLISMQVSMESIKVKIDGIRLLNLIIKNFAAKEPDSSVLVDREIKLLYELEIS